MDTSLVVEKKLKLFSPFGIPHGAGVLELSKKSKSYFRAGGNVKATWPHTRTVAELSTSSNSKFWARVMILCFFLVSVSVSPAKQSNSHFFFSCAKVKKLSNSIMRIWLNSFNFFLLLPEERKHRTDALRFHRKFSLLFTIELFFLCSSSSNYCPLRWDIGIKFIIEAFFSRFNRKLMCRGHFFLSHFADDTGAGILITAHREAISRS